jgi:PPOX class probable F420-dependent enzyme
MDPALQTARYVNLVTFRKDGREVATPIWCVALDGKLFAFTGAKLGKAKRIRATGRVKVAPCDARGGVRGAWSSGTGRVVTEAPLAARVMREIGAKYGLQYRLLTVFAWLFRRLGDRVVLEMKV